VLARVVSIETLSRRRGLSGFVFFRQFLKDPRAVGSVWPSSRFLAEAMTQGIDFDNDFIVELGCGTGAVTSHIAQKLKRPENYLGFEIRRELQSRLRIRFRELRIVAASATELHTYADLSKHPLNAIVSSLPFTSIDKLVSEQILNTYIEALSPGGVFRMFLYAHTISLPRNQRFIEKLSQSLEFSESELIVWNFPPAKVLTFRKKG
jgi:phospholipid N-methyltransferase